MTGNLSLDPTNGNSILIIKTVPPPTATDDVFCNGTGHFDGRLRSTVLVSDGDVSADGCNAGTFNSKIISKDFIFKRSDVEYQRFNATDDSLNLSKNGDMKTSTLKTNTFNFNTSTLDAKISFMVSTTEYLKYENSTVDATFNGLKILDNLFTMNIYPDGIRLPYTKKYHLLIQMLQEEIITIQTI